MKRYLPFCPLGEERKTLIWRIQNRLKSSSVEKEEFDLSQEKVFPDAVEITEITPTVDTKENPDDSANLNRVDRRREGMNESERLDSLVDELRGAAPAPGNTVAMNDLWVAFLCSLDRKDPTPELWKKVGFMFAFHYCASKTRFYTTS